MNLDKLTREDKLRMISEEPPVSVQMAEVMTEEADSFSALQLSGKHHSVTDVPAKHDDSWKEKIHKPQLNKRMAQLLQNAGII